MSGHWIKIYGVNRKPKDQITCFPQLQTLRTPSAQDIKTRIKSLCQLSGKCTIHFITIEY